MQEDLVAMIQLLRTCNNYSLQTACNCPFFGGGTYREITNLGEVVKCKCLIHNPKEWIMPARLRENIVDLKEIKHEIMII